jgi:hypothetical protein
MYDSRKFCADVRRLIKYERMQKGLSYDSKVVCSKIAALFASANGDLGNLAGSIAAYWMEKYINASQNPAGEPADENIGRLAAMQDFLNGSGDDGGILSGQDWQELGALVNCEAENLPLDLLGTLMTIIVDKKALQ